MMLDFFDFLWDGRALAPHGYCLMWDPRLVWTHVIADVLIAGAYFSIPLAIVRFVTGRKDIQFSWIFWLFALFIVACGTTHLISIWTLWHADYAFQGVIKMITAIASVGTAIVLWPLIPKALAIPSPLQLREANTALTLRIRERDEALERLQKEVIERERAEAALLQAQKMEAVGQLTGGIAHDFNNLLTAVMGGLDLVHRTTGEPRTKRLAGNALEAAQRGAKLTGQLLAFSRTQRLQLKPTAVTPLVEGMRDLLAQTLGPAVYLELALETDPEPVLADSHQLELALLNLSINARDAMPEGGTLTLATSSLRIEGDPDLPDGDYVEIRVSDTGTGMPAAVIERAFEPFFTTKDVGEGTGLGLAMVYAVARQSGGTARIESEPGHGTTVIMLLPKLAAVPEAAATEEILPAERLSPARRLLVIDDDHSVRDLLAELLTEQGHHVTAARDGPEGLARIEGEAFDLVLLDYAMPGMSGAQVAEAARRLRPGQALLFITGYAETARIEAAAGDAPVLRKPFRPEELADAIEEAIAANGARA
ncbi:MAG TPA: ATP-binding protein [Allosphingosinicella sp.]|nr:ATP-binding protein [Allosphingosinicella sp.]